MHWYYKIDLFYIHLLISLFFHFIGSHSPLTDLDNFNLYLFSIITCVLTSQQKLKLSLDDSISELIFILNFNLNLYSIHIKQIINLGSFIIEVFILIY